MAENDKKYEKIISTVRERILNGEYPAGMRLPGQNALALEFDVSPITTKRALNELQSSGFIERRPRSGSYVAEHPRILSEINIVIGSHIENEHVWLMSYWQGIEAAAAKLNIPCHLMRVDNPTFQTRVLEGPDSQGVVLLSFEDRDIIDQLNVRKIPYVVGECEAKQASYNVFINRRRAAADITRLMMHDGAEKITFFGNLTQPNHIAIYEGYLTAIKESGSQPEMFDIDEDSAVNAMQKALRSPCPPDAVLIAGGGLPFQLLPVILNNKPKTKIGVLTENTTVLQLKGTAYIGAYDYSEAGEMTMKMLYNVASGKINKPTMSFPAYKILKPEG
jgi:DNA-binding transcriptional regulator YhcF (GntR family)